MHKVGDDEPPMLPKVVVRSIHVVSPTTPRVWTHIMYHIVVYRERLDYGSRCVLEEMEQASRHVYSMVFPTRLWYVYSNVLCKSHGN